MADNLDQLGTFDDDTKALFSAVGFIVVQWSQAEQSLELASLTLFKFHGGKRIADENKLPKMLNRKIKFVSKCFNKLTHLSALKPEAMEMLELFRELSEARHNVTHGAITSLSTVDGAFEFIRLEHDNDGYTVKPYRLDAPAFPVLAKKLVRLGSLAAKLGPKLMNPRPIKNPP